MPEFAAPVVQIDPDILNMVLLPIDPAVIEAAELKEIQKDEIKAKVDEAKNLLKVRRDRVAILNGLCDEFDTLTTAQIAAKNELGVVFAQVKTTLANDPTVLENKQKIVHYFPDLMAKWKENFEAAVVKQTQKIAAGNIAALKELDASLAVLDKKIDALGKEVDDYKALATKLFAQADTLKAEYGL
jgi:uncharacterized coiled-coil DUF342 family protein